MDNDNLPGLSPLWLISLATLLGVFISLAVPAAIGPHAIKPSDWIGFAGSVLTGGIAAAAIYYAWRGLTRQLRISLISREEDRIERELPGLRELSKFLLFVTRMIRTDASADEVTQYLEREKSLKV
jgi:hypothetical protein